MSNLIASAEHLPKQNHAPGSQAATNPAFSYLLSLGSKRSRDEVRSKLSRIAALLGAEGIASCPWHELRRAHVLGLVAKLNEAGKAPSTVNAYLSAIKGVVREAWMLDQIDAEQMQRIVAVKGVRGSREAKGRALSADEVTALLEACQRDPSPLGRRDAAIIALLFGCGLRKAELVALQMKDLDLGNLTLTVLGKGNKEGKSFIPPSVLPHLESWLAIRGAEDGALFCRITKHRKLLPGGLTGQGITHILYQRNIQAGIPAFAPHDTRRTFATWLLSNGEDIITVRDAMRHASVETTQRYDRRGEGRLRRASAKITL